jgi:t-SNARE complex subunit (syntaxin)
MLFEEELLEIKKDPLAEKTQEERRQYFKKSLMDYGFTEEQAELLLQSLDEFVEEEKDLTKEAKESLYED